MFTFLAQIVLMTIDGILGMQALSPLFSLATFLPALAVAVRRLHDLDKSGWLLLLVLIPLVGAIILIIWFCTKGTSGPNRFGPDPII